MKHLPGVVYHIMFFIVFIYLEVRKINFVQVSEAIEMFGIPSLQYLDIIFLPSDSQGKFEQNIPLLRNITLHVAVAKNAPALVR